MIVFRPGPRRRAPAPFDLKVDGVGLLLGRPPAQGQARGGQPPAPQLVIAETESLANVAPTDYGYSAQSPEAERTQPYEDFTRGFGLARQQAFVDRRYQYTINANLSVPFLVLKGPEVTQFTPATTDATNGISGFFDLAGVTYALAGRYILARANDSSWTVSKDLNDYGAGTIALDAVTFYSNALAGDRAWVALSPSTVNFTEFDGTTWTQAAGATMEARAWGIVGREFYRARDTNFLTKCDTDTDPRTLANWNAANAFRIGDKGSAITRMFTNAANVLVIVKTDGIYSIAPDGQDIHYFPSLGLVPDAVNGKGAGAFGNDWYIPFREGLARLSPQFALEPDAGPEVQNGTDWLAGMRTTAFLGHGSLHAYAAVTDETDSYLMLLAGGVWHGAISERFAGKRITALWKSTVGAASGHARCYVGFSDGSVGWFLLPNAADPTTDSSYRFSTADGEVHLPDFTGQVANDTKALYAATVNGRNLGSSTSARLEYKLSPDAAGWTALAEPFDTPQERVAFPDNTTAAVVPLRLVLESAASTAGPEVTGLGLHHVWRPVRREVYQFSVLCEDGLVRWDNTPLRIGRTRIRSVVEAARDAAGGVDLVLPDHTSQRVALNQIAESVAWDDRTRQWKSALRVRAVQLTEQVVYGTYARLEALGSYAAIEALGSYARMEQA